MQHVFDRRAFLKLLAGLAGGLTYGRTSNALEAWPRDNASGGLEIVSVRPERPHLVAPGSTTSFVVAISNPGATQTTASLSIRSQSGGWTARVSQADALFQAVGEQAEELTFGLAAGERRFLLVTLGPEPGMAEGSTGTAEITAMLAGQPLEPVTVKGKVRLAPKVYFLAPDGLGRDNAKLDRWGEYTNVETDPLMPNIRAFMQDSACLLTAMSQVPSYTDPNHVSVLTGSWPGTSGAINLHSYYCGLDPNGDPILLPGDNSILRWGTNGDKVLSMFDVAKDPAMGGDPEAMNAMILGKSYIGPYFQDQQGTMDIIATGSSYPSYLPAPELYVLGDPPTDGNAPTDRDGWNLRPKALFRRIPHPPTGTCGSSPETSPSDRWIVQGALLMIAAEDPDVLYVLPGNVDFSQHHTGAVDQPDEWQDGGIPGVMWDDFNRFNLHGNRDPVLDVIHEFDALFGMVVQALQARGTYEDSVLVLLSDHGQCTFMDEFLSISQICQDAGIPSDAFEWIASVAEVSFIWLTPPSYAEAIESALQGYTVEHPVSGELVQPLIVLTLDEMLSGVDDVLGRVAANGGPKRSELYSEWYVDYPAEGKPKWPDLIVFSRYRFQIEYSVALPAFVGSHGGLGWQQRIPLCLRGPSINKGAYYQDTAYLVDIAPTLYHLLGWETPANVDGRVLSEILSIP